MIPGSDAAVFMLCGLLVGGVLFAHYAIEKITCAALLVAFTLFLA